MSLLRKAILVNSTEFVCFGIGLIQTIILTRLLGPAGIGQYSLISSTLILAAQVCCLGFPISFLYHSQHDPENTVKYLMNTIWATLLIGLVGGIALAVLVRYKSGYFGQLPWFALFGIGLFIPIVIQSAIARNRLLIQIDARRLSFMRLFVTTATFSLVLILWSLGSLGVGQAILCFVSLAVFRAGIGWYWMRDKVNFSIRPTWSVSRKLGSMGIRQYWADVMVLLNSTLNIMVIKLLIDDFASLGYFSRGLRIAMLMVTAAGAIFPILFSRWASLPADKLARHVEKVMRFTSTASVLMVAVILLSGKWIIILMYGREFLPSVRPMVILLPGTVLYLISRVLMRLLGSRGSPEWSTVALFEGVLINAALSFTLIPTMGIRGAALASTASNVGLLATLTVVVIRKYKVRLTQCLWLNRNDFKDIKAQLRLSRWKDV
jgi:O-antigen/teichoic acid export membrane protein